MKFGTLLAFGLAAASLVACSNASLDDEGSEPAPAESQDELKKGKKYCGGFAGFVCPSGYTCVDIPNDGCDPKNGGADCLGVCKPKPPSPPKPKMCGGFAGIQCPAGQVCVDDPSDSCDPQNGGADCSGICVTAPPPPPPPTKIFCGGFAGIQCPSGMTCVDDPSDSCDPQNGGADCGGVCQ
jgi:hypothetical protein